jgi:sporulation protein YlmC with PRC-barrel domain
MNKIKNLTLSAINVVQHPHSKERYIDLFKELNKNKNGIKILGQYYGQLSNIDINIDEGYIQGEIYRYTEINKNAPWLNIIEHSQILDEEGKPKSLVEEHFKPNSKKIYFYFIIKHHRLVFDKKEISPKSIKNFFENLIANTNISKELDINKQSIKITVEQSAESLEKILKLHHINKIDLVIHRPNPDDLSDDLENGMKLRLENMNADTYMETIKSEHASIEPDDILKQYMNVARSNGKVEVRGRNEAGKSITESTESHPLEVKTSYNQNIETYITAFKNHAFVLVSGIMDKIRS